MLITKCFFPIKYIFVLLIFLSGLSAQNKPIFKFSENIKLSKSEYTADSILNHHRNSLLKEKGVQWKFFREFEDYIENLRQEKLYNYFYQMPKGALLHIHLGATATIKDIIEIADRTSQCYFHNSPDDNNGLYGQLAIFTKNNVPSGWIKFSEAQKTIPNFIDKLYNLYTIDKTDRTEKDVWIEFENIFTRLGDFLTYKPIFKEICYRSFEQMAKEGLKIVEFRTSISQLTDENGLSVTDGKVLDLLKQVRDSIRIKYPDFDFSIISSGWKAQTPDKIKMQIERTNNLKKLYPDLITGFDLVGEEDRSAETEKFSSVLRLSSVPLYLHSGETLSPFNNNIPAAVNLKAKRIAHAVNLFYFPEEEKQLIENDIMIELCPLSNQGLGYVPDLRLHPGLGYLQRGIQASLGSDDPAFFKTNNLTDDFFAVYLAWNLNLASVKKLIINSINYSGQAELTKQKHLDIFNSRWNNFIDYIIRNQ